MPAFKRGQRLKKALACLTCAGTEELFNFRPQSLVLLQVIAQCLVVRLRHFDGSLAEAFG